MSRLRYSFVFTLMLLAGLLLQGCGYTTSSTLPARLRTVHVEKFKNSIGYTSQSGRNIYLPLLEVKIRDAAVDQYLFDGNLRVAEAQEADLILQGELLNYERQVLRYTDNDDAEEYRVQIVVSMKLWDVQQQEFVWVEPKFAGEATYFISGPLASSEDAAVLEATTDLARRIVERTIENW